MIDFHSDDTDRNLNGEQALKAYHNSPPIRMGVGAIARAVSQTDFHWADDVNPSGFRLHYPAPTQNLSLSDFLSIVTCYLKLTGEVYIIKKDAFDINLIPIPSHLVQEPEGGDDVYEVENSIGLSKNTFPQDELIIIKQPALTNPYHKGKGEVQALGHEVDINEAAAEHTASHLENSARPDLLASISNASRDELDKFENAMRQNHGGPLNSGKVQAFADADIDLETIQSSFSDLGLDELRRYSAKVMRHTLGIPPEVVGIVENSNRATIESAQYLFRKNVVKPVVTKITSALNNQFVEPELGSQYRLEHEEVVPRDKRFELDAMKTRPSAFTDDEVRELVGKEPLEESTENPQENDNE
jgi:HK97 family phage portal protein